MIEAGKCFCPHCVETHEGAYYGNQNLGWGVWLKHSRFGGKYRVEADGDEAPKTVLKLLSKVKESDKGMPDDITIEDVASKGIIELDRICPVCAQKRGKYVRVLRELGKYPTFVIAMIGDTAAGKSAWLDSIAVPINTEAVNLLNYPHLLDYITKSPNEVRPKSTEWDSRGQTKLLEIRNKENGRTVALVYLVDVGGELYRIDDPERGDSERPPRMNERVIRHLLKGHINYPGADAFVFVAPAVRNKGQSGGQLSADKIYAELYKDGFINGRPLAFVLTHADKLIEGKKFRNIMGFHHTQEVPVMTEDTFSLKQKTSYRREDMLKRMAVENAITRAYDSPIVGIDSTLARGFLVQSCITYTEEIVGKDGKKFNVQMEDLRKNLNVMDPLLWILNQLRLFPLKERE